MRSWIVSVPAWVSVDLSLDTNMSYDHLVIATDHDALDYGQIKEAAWRIVDRHGKYRDGVRIDEGYGGEQLLGRF